MVLAACSASSEPSPEREAPDAVAAATARAWDRVAALALESAEQDTTRLAPWSPRSWNEEHQRRIAAYLPTREPLFRAVDELFDTPGLRRALSRGEPLSREWTCSLYVQRHLTNLLCARAVILAHGGTWIGSARRLGQALDLVPLLDDGTEMGRVIGSANASIAADCIQWLLEEPATSARTFADALEPRLVHVAIRFERRALPSNFVDMAIAHSFADMARARLELCRVALAVRDRARGVTPVDPFTGAPFEIRREGDRVTVAADGPSNGHALRWSFPR